MPYQNIDASLSAENVQEIEAALEAIKQKLPFLITLTIEERRRLFKMGKARFSFVQDSLAIARANPEILPASFDLSAFERDLALAKELANLRLRVNQLNEQLDDTLIAVGSEALSSSLNVYDYLKTAAKQYPGLKGAIEELSLQFKSIRTKSPNTEI